MALKPEDKDHKEIPNQFDETINDGLPDDFDLNAKTINEQDAPGVNLEANTFVGPNVNNEEPLDLEGMTISDAGTIGINSSADNSQNNNASDADLLCNTLVDDSLAAEMLPEDVNLNSATITSPDPDLDLQAKTMDDAESASTKSNAAFARSTGVDLQAATMNTITEDVQAQWARTITDDLTEGMTIKAEEEPVVTPKANTKSTNITVNIRNVVDRTAETSDLARRTNIAKRSVSAPIPGVKADYELIDVLGEGGMGIVYRARQSSIDRSIAIKMIKNVAAADAAVRDKFLFEAAVTGDLDHPNIVPIHDLGDKGDGSLFYSMKHVKGQPWCEVIKDLPLSKNLDILDDVCNAIAFAHDRGVIHRDLKPENVMLGGYNEVLVMDWGLAAAVKAGAKAALLTKKTSVCGTPAYMSPEMAVGDGGRIGRQSDIYLLGAMLFEIVAGYPPHTGETVLKCLENAALNVIRETSEKGELIEIAEKAMAFDVSERYQTVKDLQDAISQYKSHFESNSLAERAYRDLEAAAESNKYEDFSKSVFGFQEALNLWGNNAQAAQGLTKARLSYAQCAFTKDDLDLAESQLVEKTTEFRELRNKVVEARIERDKRQRQLRMAKFGGIAAAILFVLGITVSLTVIYKQMNIAREAAIAAEKQKVLAEKESQRANDEAKKAIEQKALAEKESKRANDEAARAKESLAIAERAAIARRFIEARDRKLRDTSRWALTPEKAKEQQEFTSRNLGIPIEQVIKLANDETTIKMMLIPPGFFTMGSRPEEKGHLEDEPLHDVKITDAFYMGAYEVTRKQWESVAGYQPSKSKNRSITGRYPVESISYQDVVEKLLPAMQKFAPEGWVFDVPTEAEWEYACRSGSDTVFSYGDDESKFASFGWGKRNSDGGPKATGLLKPNSWGLYDMHGNVAEWCKDWYNENYYQKDTDAEREAAIEQLVGKSNLTQDDYRKLVKFIENPLNSTKGKSEFRVIRGGYWGIYPHQCRSAMRLSGNPATPRTNAMVGVRVVLRKKN
ncbi:MAG: SUMF1/EgtB/PvdO family nonheme iron enzyme [Planctomycetes bacterium]|nr:SUMF1/EgtB/PvdO family nonheme iron enzyme [Planctomycetota bacterium]